MVPFYNLMPFQSVIKLFISVTDIGTKDPIKATAILNKSFFHFTFVKLTASGLIC